MNGLTDNLLFSFFSVSFIAGLIMLLVPARNRFLPQKTAFFLSVPVVVLAAVSYILFLLGEHPGLFSASVPLVSSLGLNICLGADNLSMVFIFFSALFVPVSILVSRHAKRMSSFFYSLPFFSCGSMAGLFSAQDFFTFFFFWQLSAFPILFLCGIWGRQGRIAASRQFIAFHFISSLFLILGFFYLADNAHYMTGSWHFSFNGIAAAGISPQAQFYAFVLLGGAFILRVPVFPFHTWFVSTSEENLSAGNIFMAGLFVPSGIYAFIKALIPIIPDGSAVFAPLLPYFFSAGCVYSSLMAWASRSLSSMLAYIFSMHCSLVLMAAVSSVSAAQSPAVLHIVSMSVAAAAAFSLSGAIESRFKTLVLSDFGFISVKEPKFSALMMITFFSIAGLPCFGGFSGIYGIISSMLVSFPVPSFAAMAGAVCVFFCCIYALGKIISFGKKKTEDVSRLPGTVSSDLNFNEFIVVLPLSAMLLLAGIMPGLLSKIILPQPHQHESAAFMPDFSPIKRSGING